MFVSCNSLNYWRVGAFAGRVKDRQRERQSDRRFYPRDICATGAKMNRWSVSLRGPLLHTGYRRDARCNRELVKWVFLSSGTFRRWALHMQDEIEHSTRVLVTSRVRCARHCDTPLLWTCLEERQSECRNCSVRWYPIIKEKFTDVGAFALGKSCFLVRLSRTVSFWTRSMARSASMRCTSTTSSRRDHWVQLSRK